MKIRKIAVVLLLGALLVSGLSCGDGADVEPTPKPKPTPTVTTSPATTPTGAATPTPTPTTSATPVSGSDVQIHRIWYKGTFFRNEANEFVEIRNTGDSNLNLYGWVLKDITDGYPTFKFPDYVLGPGSLARVYTNEKNEAWDRLSFEYNKPIWNNTHPDTAALYNNHGQLVSTGSYELY